MKTMNLMTTFDERPNTDARSLLRLQNGVLPDAELLLQEAGYGDMRYDEEHSVFIARDAKGAPCLIFLAIPAASPLEIRALSAEQCRWAESAHPDDDAYWTSFCLENRDFYFMAPVKVRTEGSWLTEDEEAEQYLPAGVAAAGTSVAGAAFGGGYRFKLTRLLIPHLAQNGKKAVFSVKNLFERQEPNEPHATLFSTTKTCWILLLNKEDGTYYVNRPVFYHDDAPFCRMELVHIREEYPTLGLVELLHADGRTYVAECLEAAVLPDRLPRRRCYKWTLSLMAERVHQNDCEWSFSEGAFYEMQKEEYRQEHGEEPPADFAVHVNTREMRTILQNDKGEYAASCTICGVIRELQELAVSPQEFPGGRCLRALVSCFAGEEEGEESLVAVFLPEMVRGDYVPAVGDNIACSGMLLAAPAELCEATESLSDSPEVGEAQETRECAMEAALTLRQFGPYSMGLGVAAAAFVGAGWQVEHAEPEAFSRHSLPLAVANQQGELAVVFVDTVINGHAPTYPITEFRSRIDKHYTENFPLSRPCYFCTVKLDYVPTADRYKVSMTIDPPCPGVENRLCMVAPMNEQSILSISEQGVSEQQLRPEKLDEAMAARLFRDAMAEGKWGEFAKWVREELEYASDTLNSQLHGKTEYLRYMTERVEWWKQGPHPRWPYFRFSVGTVLYKGERRPCMATYYVGMLSAVAIFDDDRGLIGRMRSIPREAYCTYIEEDKPCNRNELRRDERRSPIRNVRRPPYADTQPVRLSHLPHDTEHRRILLAVLRHLEAAGTPAVGHPAACAPFPHIWFREQDMSLRYVIFGPVDAEEAEESERLQQLREWIGLLEYENLKQLSGYRGYMAYVSNDGDVTLREIPPLD